MLMNRIKEVQTGSDEACLNLIRQFNPLLKKYARKLYYDDAYNDLLVEFLSLVKYLNINRLRNHSDGVIVAYIFKSIHSRYLHLSKAKNKYMQKIRPLSALSEEEQYYVEVSLSSFDNYDILQIIDLEKILTDHEISIIYIIYVLGFSSSDIARKLGVSRQSVNQTKVRAFKKIKSSYCLTKIG